MTPDLKALITAHEDRVALHRIAQNEEILAGRAMFQASSALRGALNDHVRRFFVEGALLKTRAHGEIRIVGIAVPAYTLPEVRAVFKRRIKSGKWGKTNTSSNLVVWDFEQDRWRSRIKRGGALIWDEDVVTFPAEAQP